MKYILIVEDDTALREGLATALQNQDRVDKIWSCDPDSIDENALSVTVKRLRDKLGTDCIGTIYGLGYVWKGAQK